MTHPSMSIALAVVVAAAMACSADEETSPTGVTAPEVAATAGSRSTEIIELPSMPVGIAEVDGSPWTAHPDTGTVRTASGTEVEVGTAPLRLASTPQGVWVSVIGDGTVVRLDPATGDVDLEVRLRPAGSEPEGLAWDGENLWVVDQAHDRVVAIDSEGAVARSFPTDSGPRLAAAGRNGVWVTSYGASSLTRVRQGRVDTAPLPGCIGPQGVAEAAGKVWVACTLNSVVVALDATTLDVVATIPDVPAADAVVATRDSVYVIGQTGPTVYRVDPSTASLASTTPLDEALPAGTNVDAAVVGPDLLVTYPNRIYRTPLASFHR